MHELTDQIATVFNKDQCIRGDITGMPSKMQVSVCYIYLQLVWEYIKHVCKVVQLIAMMYIHTRTCDV